MNSSSADAISISLILQHSPFHLQSDIQKFLSVSTRRQIKKLRYVVTNLMIESWNSSFSHSLKFSVEILAENQGKETCNCLLTGNFQRGVMWNFLHETIRACVRPSVRAFVLAGRDKPANDLFCVYELVSLKMRATPFYDQYFGTSVNDRNVQ